MIEFCAAAPNVKTIQVLIATRKKVVQTKILLSKRRDCKIAA